MKYKKCKQMLLDAGYYEVNRSDIYVCRFRKDRYKVIVAYNKSGNVTSITCFDDKNRFGKKGRLIDTRTEKECKDAISFLVHGLPLQDTLDMMCGDLVRIEAKMNNYLTLDAIEKL